MDVSGIIESMIITYNGIKSRYDVSMSLEDLAVLVVDLRKHNEMFQKALDLANLSGISIKPEWISAHQESTDACGKLTTSVTALQQQGSGPAASPVKLLANIFETHGNLIRWVDQIEDIYGDDFNDLAISLPRIVVVGEENVGKSSVLESIAGISIFPRAEGICTRLPFQMRMHHRTPEKMMQQFSYLTPSEPTSVKQSTFVAFEDDPKNLMQSPDAIRGKVTDITKKKTGGKGVKDEVVVLNVYSANVTDLTLIDLPGIINAHRAGEPENIYETTLGIVQKYINSTDTIILAVIPALIPLGNSQALREVQKAKALNRTIAVITKVDLATPRDKVEQKIMGTTSDNVVLPNGYIGVINADTEQPQSYTEEDFFKQHYPQLWQQGKAGTAALTKQLNHLLDKHIRSVWAPKTKSIIQRKQNKVKKQLDELGPPLPHSNVKEYFQRELAQFCTKFAADFEARQSHFFLSLSEKMFLLTASAKKESKVENQKQDIIFGMLNFVDTYIEGAMKNSMDICKLLRFPSLCEKINMLYRQLATTPKEKCMELLTQIIDVDATSLPAPVSQLCVADQQSQQLCVICREDMNGKSSGGIVTLHCSDTARHAIHVKCFIPLVGSAPIYSNNTRGVRCPTCRATVPSSLEKAPRSDGQIDPVMVFAMKAIGKFFVGEVKGRFPLTLESEFGEKAGEEYVAENFKEDTSNISKRQIYSKQLEVLRGALMEIMKYTQ